MSQPYTIITNEAELDEFLSQSGPRWLFKHSTACSISFAALDQFTEYLGAKPEGAAMVVIQDNRPLSNKVAEVLKYTHQSPQLFLLNDDKVAWHASHWSITSAAMAQARAS